MHVCVGTERFLLSLPAHFNDLYVLDLAGLWKKCTSTRRWTVLARREGDHSIDLLGGAVGGAEECIVAHSSFFTPQSFLALEFVPRAQQG